MNFYSQYQKWILDQYPEIQPFFKKSYWKHIVFPEIVTVPTPLFQQIEKVVSVIYSLKSDRGYLDFLRPRENEAVHIPHPQSSVLMAYDFHIDSSGNPRLIEVNTNGAGFLIANAVYQTHGLGGQRALEDLIQSFQEEWRSFQKGRNASPDISPKRVALMDESPFQQKMILEFLMYRKIFNSMNWPSDIYDSADLMEDSKGFLREKSGQVIEFVYNRSTDFYFEKTPHLLKAYKKGAVCFSPHPSEYFLLSDKNRLCEWFLHREDWLVLNDIQKNLIESHILTEKNASWAWKNKKKLFFKISFGSGGRQAYRGKNLTQGKFRQLCKSSVLFQEYIPPSVFQDSLGQEWKFDLRAYVYKGHIQQIAARCYRGQVTNFQEEGGGFAAVKFV